MLCIFQLPVSSNQPEPLPLLLACLMMTQLEARPLYLILAVQKQMQNFFQSKKMELIKHILMQTEDCLTHQALSLVI